jgi:hypothetical protein
MDGSSIDLIITVVVVISLAAWLIGVFYAVNHPAWKHGPAAPRQARPTALPGAAVPHVIAARQGPVRAGRTRRRWLRKLTPSLPAAGLSAGTGAGPGGFADPADMSHRDQVVNGKSQIAMSGRRRKEPVAANADLILASELSAHPYAVHFEAQMRGGKVGQLLYARPLGRARFLRR